MTKVEKALTLFERYNCAQSVFAGCSGGEELTDEMCFRLAAAFGGGMGRMGGTCGALTGAFLALGIRHGHPMATDPEQSRGPFYERVRALAEAFRARNGAVSCRELTGCDLLTPDGNARFKAEDLHHKLCSRLVASAVELVEGSGPVSK